MIEFRNVHAAYDDQLPVLRDVGFTIDDGEFVAFVGTNGAGKSTTMRLMNGLLKPSEGTVLLNGTPTTELRTQSWLPLPESRSADLLQHRARRATLRIQSARAPR